MSTDTRQLEALLAATGGAECRIIDSDDVRKAIATLKAVQPQAEAQPARCAGPCPTCGKMP